MYLVIIALILLELVMMLLFYTIYKQQNIINDYERTIEHLEEQNKRISRNLENSKENSFKYFLKLHRIEALFNSSITYDATTLTRKIKEILNNFGKRV